MPEQQTCLLDELEQFQVTIPHITHHIGACIMHYIRKLFDVLFTISFLGASMCGAMFAIGQGIYLVCNQQKVDGLIVLCLGSVLAYMVVRCTDAYMRSA